MANLRQFIGALNPVQRGSEPYLPPGRGDHGAVPGHEP